jgi:NitT/TauT family transport system substrate-binding protein
MTNMSTKLQEQIFLQGQVDSLVSYDVNLYFNLAILGKDPERDVRWFPFGDYGLSLYANGIMVSQKLIKEKPEKVAGLVRAINRATKETAADVNPAMAALMKSEPLLNQKIETQRLAWVFKNDFMSAETDRIGFGDVDDKRLTESIEILATAYDLPRKPAVSEIFNRSFLPPLSDRSFRFTST